ncbi:TPA: hypothetical protein ACQ8DB_005011, partial [Klebsiella pneumoniae]
ETYPKSDLFNKALLLCHGTVCVVGKMRDMILQLSKSSIYSTKPPVDTKVIWQMILAVCKADFPCIINYFYSKGTKD